MRRTFCVAIVVGLLLAVASPMKRGTAQAGKGLVVVIAPAFPVKDISLANLRRAFEGLATEVGGKKVIPINHPTGTPARTSFDRVVLGLEPAAVGQFWVDRRIRAEGAPPKTVPSPELALRVVASLVGAITYVAPELANASVKVLTIDGKAPGQPGYPLAK